MQSGEETSERQAGTTGRGPKSSVCHRRELHGDDVVLRKANEGTTVEHRAAVLPALMYSST